MFVSEKKKRPPKKSDKEGEDDKFEVGRERFSKDVDDWIAYFSLYIRFVFWKMMF